MLSLPPPPPVRPLARQRAGAILYSLTAVALAVWLVTLPSTPHNQAPRSDFEHSVLGADRLVVHAGEQTFLDLQGAAEIERFLAAVDWHPLYAGDIKDHTAPIRCSLVFYRGDVRIIQLDNVAGYALRWREGPWPGAVILTLPARGRLNEWYLEKGVPELRPHRRDTASHPARPT